ncbi:hypothetical protein GGF42_004816 [Coemansia sp. RSA 2424]|nr:hypothetical protein GGF42_004816 [Coemansia sp. RSA 2424]
MDILDLGTAHDAHNESIPIAAFDALTNDNDSVARPSKKGIAKGRKTPDEADYVDAFERVLAKFKLTSVVPDTYGVTPYRSMDYQK